MSGGLEALQARGIRARLRLGQLQINPPAARLSPEQIAALEQEREAALVELRALEEHALGFARHYIREAWKFIGGAVAVDLSELYRAYVEAVQRDPFGDHFGAVSLEVFSEEWDAHELREERAAIITEAEGVPPVEAERAAGFPVEVASSLPLQAQGQRGGFDPSKLDGAIQEAARGIPKARKQTAGEAPAPVEVFLKQELLFSDRRFEAGALAELIHPDHRDGLDEADQAWLDARADRVRRLEGKVKNHDKEALPQLEELRGEALVLLAGRVRAVPRGALGRVQEGRRP